MPTMVPDTSNSKLGSTVTLGLIAVVIGVKVCCERISKAMPFKISRKQK